MSISPARLVTVLVDDQTLTMVFFVQAFVRAPSVKPPLMSTTDSPSTSMAMHAPTSSSETMLSASAARTLSKRWSQCP
jgi:hypothetical protein